MYRPFDKYIYVHRAVKKLFNKPMSIKVYTTCMWDRFFHFKLFLK